MRYWLSGRLVISFDVSSRVEVGLLGLQQRRLADHLDTFRQGADREREVQAQRVAGGDRNASLCVLTEPRQGCGQVVGAGRQVAKGVDTVGVRDGLRPKASADVGHDNRCAGSHAPLRIGHGADDGTVKRLAGGGNSPC